MAMTAMDIYKLLPRTNCGECGTPTCLAFAMQLANKQASLDACPHASDEARDALAAAAEPPITLVKIGTDDKEIEIGKETVMFRHEETFHNQCAITVCIPDSATDVDARIEKINALTFERIGDIIGADIVAVEDTDGDAERFASVVQKVLEGSNQAIMLMSFDPAVVETTFENVPGLAAARPLVYGACADNWEAMADLAVKYDVPLGVYADGLEPLAELTPKIKEKGVREMVIDSGARDVISGLTDLTQIRRQALSNNFRPLGYPAFAFARGEDEQQVALDASVYVAKYAGVVVIEGDEPWQVLPLATLRQNIYTDPRVPPTVEAKLYEVGEPGADSPVIMTTNFALTYFTVFNEVEASRVPAWVVVVDTEGQSVLTAYSSENLSAEIAAKAMAACGIEDKVNHRDIIIPGYVAVMSGALEEEAGWNVIVGPREATAIPAYLRRLASESG